MYLGLTRVGSLSIADTELEELSTSGRPVDDRVDSLISRIRPARHSEQRRHQVAKYVSSLIARSFHAEHEVRTPCTSLLCLGQRRHMTACLTGGSFHVWLGASQDIPAGRGYRSVSFSVQRQLAAGQLDHQALLSLGRGATRCICTLQGQRCASHTCRGVC